MQHLLADKINSYLYQVSLIEFFHLSLNQGNQLSGIFRAGPKIYTFNVQARDDFSNSRIIGHNISNWAYIFRIKY